MSFKLTDELFYATKQLASMVYVCVCSFFFSWLLYPCIRPVFVFLSINKTHKRSKKVIKKEAMQRIEWEKHILHWNNCCLQHSNVCQRVILQLNTEKRVYQHKRCCGMDLNACFRSILREFCSMYGSIAYTICMNGVHFSGWMSSYYASLPFAHKKGTSVSSRMGWHSWLNVATGNG